MEKKYQLELNQAEALLTKSGLDTFVFDFFEKVEKPNLIYGKDEELTSTSEDKVEFEYKNEFTLEKHSYDLVKTDYLTESKDTGGDAGTEKIIVFGNGTDEIIQGTNTTDFLFGNGGNDYIYGNGGTDLIFGGSGDDTIDTWGSTSSDFTLVIGGIGNDTLNSYDSMDFFFGGTGNDTAFSGAGNDILFGGADDDELYGEDGNDFIFGGTGNDTLVGGEGNNSINGGDGNDLIVLNNSGQGGGTLDYANGGAGDDIIISNDIVSNIITGGIGADTFRYFFAGGGNSAGVSTITDFDVNQDSIEYQNWTGVTPQFSTVGNDLHILFDVPNFPGVDDLTIVLQGLSGINPNSIDIFAI